MINVPDLGLTFVHGEVLPTAKPGINSGFFVPGIYSECGEKSELRFHPGLVSETRSGIEFVEGKLCKVADQAVFVPGKIHSRDNRFEKVADERGMNRYHILNCNFVNKKIPFFRKTDMSNRINTG